MPVAKGQKKRQYTDKIKAEVLAAAAVDGNIKKLSRQTGIPRGTIENWRNNIGINDDVRNITHVKREEIRDLHKLVAVKALGLLQTKMEDCTGAQLSTISGISTEKYLLLDGQPTNITENRSETAEQAIKRYMDDSAKAGAPCTREVAVQELAFIMPELVSDAVQ